MKYVKKRKTKCIKCGKLKTLARFGEVDMFWGNFKICSWCKVCDKKLDKQHNKARKEFNKKHEQIRKEFVKNGGVLKRPIVGACEESSLPDGKLFKPACKGWYAEEGKDNRVINGIPIRKMEPVL